MSADDFYQAEMVLSKLSAREHLLEINAVSYPYGKESWKDKYHRMIHKIANPKEQIDNPDDPSFSTEDLARLLGGRS